MIRDSDGTGDDNVRSTQEDMGTATMVATMAPCDSSANLALPQSSPSGQPAPYSNGDDTSGPVSPSSATESSLTNECSVPTTMPPVPSTMASSITEEDLPARVGTVEDLPARVGTVDTRAVETEQATAHVSTVPAPTEECEQERAVAEIPAPAVTTETVAAEQVATEAPEQVATTVEPVETVAGETATSTIVTNEEPTIPTATAPTGEVPEQSIVESSRIEVKRQLPGDFNDDAAPSSKTSRRASNPSSETIATGESPKPKRRRRPAKKKSEVMNMNMDMTTVNGEGENATSLPSPMLTLSPPAESTTADGESGTERNLRGSIADSSEAPSTEMPPTIEVEVPQVKEPEATDSAVPSANVQPIGSLEPTDMESLALAHGGIPQKKRRRKRDVGEVDGEAPPRRRRRREPLENGEMPAPRKRKSRRKADQAEGVGSEAYLEKLKNAEVKVKLEPEALPMAEEGSVPSAAGSEYPGEESSEVKQEEYGSAPHSVPRKSRALLPCCVPHCKNVGKTARPADEIGPAGIRCRVHGSGHICSMPHCWFLGSIMIMPAVGDKPAQFLCDTHGKVCVVAGCKRVGKRRVTEIDQFGPPGFRCLHHGGGHVCSVTGCNKLSVQKKREADHMGPEGYRCLNHTGHICNVIDCNDPCVTNLRVADNFGPAGMRCQRHGKVCVVPGCQRSGKRKRDEDDIGPEGYRCLSHGGGYACTVPGCVTVAKVLVRLPDAKGPAGFRCNLHGRPCNIQGCVRVGRRRRPADEIGPEGFRCGYHGGGHECSVPGCANVATILKPRDYLGPAGYRCTTHGNLCNVVGCCTTGRSRCKADRQGAAGWRCKAHMGAR